MMKARFVALLTVVFLGCGVVWTTGGEPGSPNIVLIISDDQAWTDYSFMGHPHIRTPRIDRLADEGLTFTRGYVPASLCSPSLVSIITGLYPHQHGMTSNDPPLPAGVRGAAVYRDPGFRRQQQRVISRIDDLDTLPRLLARKGYLSFQSGKWWMGHYSRGGFTHGMTHGDPDRGGRHGDEGLKIGREGCGPIQEFLSTAREAKKPFFIWYAPFLPHQPHNPPERLLERYKAVAPSLHAARYWAMVEWFDETVGELLDLLDKESMSENTVVVYVTDNGWIQDPDRARYGPRSKRSPYDGGLRTPIVIRWPGRVKPMKTEALASSLDLVPTLLTATGIEGPSDLPGIDLLDSKAREGRTSVFGECFTHNAVDIDDPVANLRWRWVIEGDWKLIVPYAGNEGDAPMELYHLGDDPFERRDLAGSEAEQVGRLLASLNGWWDPGSAGRE